MNNRYITSTILGVGSAAIGAACLAPTIEAKLNEHAESKFDRIRHTVGILAGCFAIGYAIGTLLNIEECQLQFIESCVIEATK